MFQIVEFLAVGAHGFGATPLFKTILLTIIPSMVSFSFCNELQIGSHNKTSTALSAHEMQTAGSQSAHTETNVAQQKNGVPNLQDVSPKPWSPFDSPRVHWNSEVWERILVIYHPNLRCGSQCFSEQWHHLHMQRSTRRLLVKRLALRTGVARVANELDDRH